LPGAPVGQRGLGQGVHDRCEAYVFADGTADEADRARLATHLPFAARQLSVLYRRVAAGEIWDLTVEHRMLGIDDRDDLLNVVNVITSSACCRCRTRWTGGRARCTAGPARRASPERPAGPEAARPACRR
jgi:hypothetical protein